MQGSPFEGSRTDKRVDTRVGILHCFRGSLRRVDTRVGIPHIKHVDGKLVGMLAKHVDDLKIIGKPEFMSTAGPR